jgi:hypothetical protein
VAVEVVIVVVVVVAIHVDRACVWLMPERTLPV